MLTNHLTVRRQHELRSCARQGAAFLDGRDPGWHKAVAASRLDMADPCKCVLGQRSGSFQLGVWEHTLGGWETFEYGFAIPESGGPALDGFERDMEEYHCLTDAWRREINDRREKDHEQPSVA
jgi:hypothetical protein